MGKNKNRKRQNFMWCIWIIMAKFVEPIQRMGLTCLEACDSMMKLNKKSQLYLVVRIILKIKVKLKKSIRNQSDLLGPNHWPKGKSKPTTVFGSTNLAKVLRKNSRLKNGCSWVVGDSQSHRFDSSGALGFQTITVHQYQVCNISTTILGGLVYSSKSNLSRIHPGCSESFI